MKALLGTLSLIGIFVLVPLAAAADLQSDLIAKEKTMWTAWGKKDAEPFKKLLTADHVEIPVGEAPIMGREATIKGATSHSCELRSFSFQDPNLQQLSQDVVTLSFTAIQDTVCNGKPAPSKLAVSSVWQRQNGKWLNASYHESAIE